MMKPLVVFASVLLLTACGNSTTSSGNGASSGDTSSAAPAPSATADTSTPSTEIGNWKMIPELSRITFQGTQTGDKFTGEFKRFSTVIQLDPNDLPNSHVEVTVDMASADAMDEQRNQALPGAEWFGVSQFPTAVFRSETIKRLDDGKYEADGKLTIKDATQDVSLPFTLDIDGDKARAFGETSLMRNLFKVGTGEWEDGKWVGLDVMVIFDITATRIGS